MRQRQRRRLLAPSGTLLGSLPKSSLPERLSPRPYHSGRPTEAVGLFLCHHSRPNARSAVQKSRCSAVEFCLAWSRLELGPASRESVRRRVPPHARDAIALSPLRAPPAVNVLAFTRPGPDGASAVRSDAMMTHDADVKAILKQCYPAAALRCMEANGTTIVVLQPSQTFSEVSPALRRLALGIDRWPIPPAGLFVTEEHAIYLRSKSPMTICHEAGHALDSALGGGVYLSGIDPKIRRAFAAASAFVTPYAASACDEYFAESVRAGLARMTIIVSGPA